MGRLADKLNVMEVFLEVSGKISYQFAGRLSIWMAGHDDASHRRRDSAWLSRYKGGGKIGVRFFRLKFDNQVLYSLEANGILIIVFKLYFFDSRALLNFVIHSIADRPGPTASA
jgi:hypothetical protein